MYNRYIPGTNGVYERQTIPEPKKEQSPCPQPTEAPCPTSGKPTACSPENRPQSFLPNGLDVGDLLLLCIILLLLLDSDQEDITGILITAAAFLFLQ